MNAFALRGSADRATRPERMSSRRVAPRNVAASLLVAAVAVAGWWFLAPPSLGGTTSLAIVDGTSMLPHFHRNDIVLIRASGRNRVGDVVSYKSALLHRVVLHRIVKISHGRYTFKGDNNSWTDPEQPTRSDLIGKQWIQLGQAGQLVPKLRAPAAMAALAVLIVLAFGLGAARPKDTAEGT